MSTNLDHAAHHPNRDHVHASRSSPVVDLPEIPVLDTGPDFPLETLLQATDRAHALMDLATRGVPRAALHALDGVSRRWLAKSTSPHLSEIDQIARQLDRPGAYFLSVNYEWGCTTGVRPAPDGVGAQLVRVLDWRTNGLGRHVVAARVSCALGPFISLTWPGYTGVLQAVAPGRFAAAINQAPMPRTGGGFYPLDWFANKVRVWSLTHETASHVLRHVFETAADFDAARRLLIETPIASPVIYALSGRAPSELCIIERREAEARVHDGPAAAANAWRTPDWQGRPRGDANPERICLLEEATLAGDDDMSWLEAPVLNPLTRLAMIANASKAAVTAQGFEDGQPATAVLTLRR
ncbi:MAG: hypothetical protein AAGC70_03850 [Pseudomonadota bacterium]